MIKTIIFDLGGVYFTKGTDIAYKKLIKAFPDISPKKISGIIHGGIGEKYRLGKITKKDFWSQAKKNVGFNFDVKRFAEIWHSSYKLNKDVEMIVKKLRKHYKMVVLSGNTRERVKFLENKYGFKKYFDIIVLSYNVGANKYKGSITNVDSKIYEHLFRRLKQKGEGCVLIDDNKIFLEPAKKLGMKTIHFKNAKQLKKELKKLGVKV